MCSVLSLPVISFVFVVIRILTDKEPTGENPSSVSEPGARDTKFQLPVSIHFFKTFCGWGGEAIGCQAQRLTRRAGFEPARGN